MATATPVYPQIPQVYAQGPPGRAKRYAAQAPLANRLSVENAVRRAQAINKAIAD